MSIGNISKKRKAYIILTILVAFGFSIFLIRNYEFIDDFKKNLSYAQTMQKEESQNILIKEEVGILEKESDTKNTTKEIKGWSISNSSKEYSLTYNENDELLLHFENTDTNGTIIKEIPLSYINGKLINSLSIKFRNINNSVSHISFYLQGDEKMLINNEENRYMEYFEEKIGEFNVGDYESGMINMVIDIEDALTSLEGHMKNGLKLAMRVESDYNYENDYDRKGEMIIESIEPLMMDYAENSFTPWVSSGSYNIDKNKITYSNTNDFDNISTKVKNYNYKCKYLNLELKSIDKSVENIVVNVYGQNNEVANINIDLNKKSKINYNLSYNLLEYNNKLGNVERIELLIDSSPYKNISNKKGELEIISMYFSASKK